MSTNFGTVYTAVCIPIDATIVTAIYTAELPTHRTTKSTTVYTIYCCTFLPTVGTADTSAFFSTDRATKYPTIATTIFVTNSTNVLSTIYTAIGYSF